jgi:hypothetical protein
MAYHEKGVMNDLDTCEEGVVNASVPTPETEFEQGMPCTAQGNQPCRDSMAWLGA